MVMFAGELATSLDDQSPLLLDYISSNSARVMGHSPISLLSDPGSFLDLVHADDRAAARRRPPRRRRGPQPGTGGVPGPPPRRHVAVDGGRWSAATRPTRPGCSATPSTSPPAGRPRQAQQESESRLSAFLDNSNALISLKDPFGRYQFANRALAELFGAAGGRIVGTDDFDHWPDAAPMLRARDQQILVTREPMQFEEVIELADGPHTFLSVKFPLLDPDGVPVAVGSISTDITEVKEAVGQRRRPRACAVHRHRRVARTSSRSSRTTAPSAPRASPSSASSGTRPGCWSTSASSTSCTPTTATRPPTAWPSSTTAGPAA